MDKNFSKKKEAELWHTSKAFVGPLREKERERERERQRKASSSSKKKKKLPRSRAERRRNIAKREGKRTVWTQFRSSKFGPTPRFYGDFF